jgi:hypothetical protein
MKLMGHVRALLMENPELLIPGLYARIAPLFPDTGAERLIRRIGICRSRVLKQGRPCRHCKGTGFES